MSLNRFKDDECYLSSEKHCPCIEFLPTNEERYGFHSSQLLSYHLVAGDGDPPNQLTLAFTTSDVVISGWHLDRIADRLRDGDLLSVRAGGSKACQESLLSNRYASVEPPKCLVAAITVTPINKQ